MLEGGEVHLEIKMNYVKESLVDRAAKQPDLFSRIIASAFQQGVTRDELEAHVCVIGRYILDWPYGSNLPDSAGRRRVVAWLEQRLPPISIAE